MTGPIPPRRRNNRRRAAADGRRARSDEANRCSGRQKVENVVESRRGPAEILVAATVVADHRIEGVGRAVSQEPGDTGDRTPEERRNDGVRGVLGNGFDGGPGDLIRIQFGGIASDQVGDLLSSRSKIVVGELARDRPGLALQRPAAQHEEGAGSGQCDLGESRVATDSLDQDPDCRGAADQCRGIGDAGRPIVPVHGSLDRRSGGAERGHGVKPTRVAQCGIQCRTEQQPDRPSSGSGTDRHRLSVRSGLVRQNRLRGRMLPCHRAAP